MLERLTFERKIISQNHDDAEHCIREDGRERVRAHDALVALLLARLSMQAFGVTSHGMNTTVFLTVISGVITYVLVQLVLKLLIEPVQEMKKLIGQIAHSLIEHANVIQNPGVPTEEVVKSTSQHLRKLSALLEAQLYLVPMYRFTATVFRLPSRERVLSASRSLMGLSNSVFRATDRIYESNAKRVENIHDSLGLYLAEGDRWPEEPS